MLGRLARCIVPAAWLVLLVRPVGTAPAPLAITTTSLPSIAVGSSVRIKINASGGALPLTWKVSGGNLPPGLKLNATRGVIVGTATTPGDYNFENTVTGTRIPDPAFDGMRSDPRFVEFSMVRHNRTEARWASSGALSKFGYVGLLS